MCVSSASKSKPLGSTLDSAGAAEDKDKEKTVPSAAKTQDNTPTTPTKTDREKKDKPSKKKEKSLKGASANLPPVESKPPPGPLVALGRRDKPLKRPRSVEKGPQSLSCPHTLYSLCGVCVCVCFSSASSVVYHHQTSELSVFVCVFHCSSRLDHQHKLYAQTSTSRGSCSSSLLIYNSVSSHL